MTHPKPANDSTPIIEGPAKVTQLHVQDRTFRNDGGQIVSNQTAFRVLSQIENYYDRGFLGGGNPTYSAEARYQAGLDYEQLYATWMPAGRDSTQALNVSRSTGGDGGSANKAFAGLKIACIHSHLGRRDREIIHLVCGMGYTPAEAVRNVCNDFKDTVSARFREALDGLCEALETCRRDGWRKIDMQVRP